MEQLGGRMDNGCRYYMYNKSVRFVVTYVRIQCLINSMLVV